METLTSSGYKLFERLKKLRLEIAREESMPPYIIFSDKTLIDMAAKSRLPSLKCWMFLGWAKINLRSMERGSLRRSRSIGGNKVIHNFSASHNILRKTSRSRRKQNYDKSTFYLPWHSSFMIMHTFADWGNIWRKILEILRFRLLRLMDGIGIKAKVLG